MSLACLKSPRRVVYKSTWAQVKNFQHLLGYLARRPPICLTMVKISLQYQPYLTYCEFSFKFLTCAQTDLNPAH